MVPGEEINKEHNKEDVYSGTSDKKGIGGFIEKAIRRFRTAAYLIALVPLYLVCIFSMGISAIPGIYLFQYLTQISIEWGKPLHYGATGIGLVAGYFLYGLCLIFVVPLVNFLLPLKVKPFRGGFYSLQSIPWYFHNALTYTVRYTFLEFLTPTPLNILFYRLMGMKIGRNSHINTTNISDPCLIEIGDKVTVGGSATIIAHYASQGYLVLDHVKINDGVTIGLKATIMGNVEIGEGATIGPHEVILPKSRIPAGRKFGE